MNNIIRMAFKNIFRNKRRTIITSLSIILAVLLAIFMRSFVTGLVDSITTTYIYTQSAHIRVMQKEYHRKERLLPLDLTISNYQGAMDGIKKDPLVTVVSPRIKFGVLLAHNNKTKMAMGIGIDPQKDDQITGLNKKIVVGQNIKMGKDQVVIGSGLAQKIGLKEGDVLTVVTQTAFGSIGALNLKVVGISHFGTNLDNNTFFIPLDRAQYLLDIGGQVTEIMVLINNGDLAPSISKIMVKDFPDLMAVPWQEQGIIYSWMKMAKTMYFVMYLIVLSLGNFTIINTMFMAVFERMRELGMLQAMGMRKSSIISMIILEAFIIGAFAALIGIAIGSTLVYFTSQTGVELAGMQDMGDFPIPNKLYPKFSWFSVFMIYSLGVMFTILASIPPALSAVSKQPAETLRNIT